VRVIAVSAVLLASSGVLLPGCGGSDADEKAGSKKLISAQDAETQNPTAKGKKAQEAEAEIFQKSRKLR
jgi:hypothetical protein